MLELIALALLQLATMLGNPRPTAPGSSTTVTAPTGGGDWGEGHAQTPTVAPPTGGGDWGEGHISKP